MLAGLTLAGTVSAHPPVYPAPPPFNPAATAGGDSYGLPPCLKKLFGCGCKTKCKAAPVPAMYGPAGGTLVFPVNPFIRAPRDYFMQYDP